MNSEKVSNTERTTEVLASNTFPTTTVLGVVSFRTSKLLSTFSLPVDPSLDSECHILTPQPSTYYMPSTPFIAGLVNQRLYQMITTPASWGIGSFPCSGDWLRGLWCFDAKDIHTYAAVSFPFVAGLVEFCSTLFPTASIDPATCRLFIPLPYERVLLIGAQP